MRFGIHVNNVIVKIECTHLAHYEKVLLLELVMFISLGGDTYTFRINLYIERKQAVPHDLPIVWHLNCNGIAAKSGIRITIFP